MTPYRINFQYDFTNNNYFNMQKQLKYLLLGKPCIVLMTDSRGIKFILNSLFSSMYCLDGQLTSVLKINLELTFVSQYTPKLCKKKRNMRISLLAHAPCHRAGVQEPTCVPFFVEILSQTIFPGEPIGVFQRGTYLNI